MANNLRKFNTLADYQAAELVKPAVSLIADTDDVYFDQKDAPVPPTPTFSGLTAHYYIDSVGDYILFNGGGGSGSGSGSGGVLPSAMIIDGTEVEVTATYQFDTVGEHVVNYSFADNQIPDNFMSGGLMDSTHLVGIEIGDGITSIGDSAFYYCTSLTTCTIGSGVTSIDTSAFEECSGLTSIDIPNSVTTIDGSAFKNCSGLTSVTVNATTPPELGLFVFDSTNNCPIYVPQASVNTYKSASGWSSYTSRIQAIQ